MKRLAAALFGLFVAVGVLSAAPASATGIQVTGNVYNTAVISINDGTVEFYDSCDAQTPVATDSFITASYSAEVPAYGTYYVRILPAQGFAALASWNGGSDTCAGSDAITVSDGNTFHGVFAKKATVAIFEVRTNANLITDGQISVYSSCQDYNNGNAVASETFSSGTANIALLPGDYKVFIQPADGMDAIDSWHNNKATCAAADLVTVPDAQITIIQVYGIGVTQVAGLVSSDRGYVDSGIVQFYKSCNDYLDSESAAFALVSNSSYSVGLPPGTYKAQITPFDESGALQSWHNEAGSCAGAATITVGTNNPQQQNLVAQAGVFVEGMVTAGSLLDGVDSGSVYFYDSCSTDGYYTNIAGGHYRALLPPNQYKAQIFPDGKAVDSWHSAKSTCLEADLIDATGSDVTVDLLAKKGASVTGSVSSSNGPVQTGRVEFYSSCEAFADRNRSADVAIANGGYAAVVPDGTYRVLIKPDGGKGALRSWHSAKPNCDQATTVTVTGDTTVDLTATAGSNVTGTVSNGTDPLAAGNVAFFATCDDLEAGDPAASGEFSPNYALTVPNGTYRVYITPESGEPAADSFHSAKPTCAEATTVKVEGNTAINLVARNASQVGGDVTSSAGPVTSGNVAFYKTCEDYTDDNPAGNTTISSGSYSTLLPNGTYRALIYPGDTTGAGRSWHNAATSCADATVVNINGDNANVDLTARAGYDVTGTVTRGGNAVRSGQVQFFATCEDFAADERYMLTDINNGEYSTHLAEGTYYARITQYFGNGDAYSWHSEAASCADATLVNVQSATTADLKALPTSIVEGTVVGPNGLLGDGTLQFFDTCNDYTANNPAAQTQFHNGQYAVRLPDGTFLSRIVPDDGSAAISWHNQGASCDQAAEVTSPAAPRWVPPPSP